MTTYIAKENNMSGQIDDIVKISPTIHKVIFENDQIRVLKVIVKPGDTVAMHRNPENVNYILKSGTLRLTNPDGSSVNIDLTEGQVIPAPVGSHAVENIGSTEVQTICIELKTNK
jgi:quercetin dioxygenase-like cupin family protein